MEKLTEEEKRKIVHTARYEGGCQYLTGAWEAINEVLESRLPTEPGAPSV